MTVADIPEGYIQVNEDDARKAKVFFERAQTVAGTGNFDYSIEMYIQGLNLDPDAVEAHQALREISLKRKATGGKSLGMFEAMKLKRPTKDDKQNLLNAEKLLAYDPGNTDYMVSMFQNAHRAGCYDTCVWIGPILQKANADSRNPDFNKFIIIKDIFKDLDQWKLATDACHYAAMLRQDDMELQTELKNLGAQHTMSQGKYGSAKSFRDSIRDMDKQQKLLERDKDVLDEDALTRQIKDAEAEWQADPNEAGKLMKLIDALEKTEDVDYENRAIELLQQSYERTKQFRFRQRIGKIQMKQWGRHERAKRTALQADPTNADLRKEYADFKAQQTQFELDEFALWSDNYPTDMGLKYEMALRMFQLHKYDDAIPVLQQVRTDPKYRADATIILARAFFEAGFTDEAAETLEALINEYQLRGDSKSKEMYYWRARAMEQKSQNDVALKLYSQVAQWDFNYRDVQARIKKLRVPRGVA